MSLKRVRMELARTKEFPEGNSAHGYEFIAPLTEDGHLDAQAWAEHKAECRVTRFAPDEEDEFGHLVHHRSAWRFDYEAGDAEDDEPLFKLDRHRIVAGEYLSVAEWDGVLRTFKIVRVTPFLRTS